MNQKIWNVADLVFLERRTTPVETNAWRHVRHRMNHPSPCTGNEKLRHGVSVPTWILPCGIATLQGWTVKIQNRRIPNHQRVQIPAPIIAQCRNVRLFTDIFWVNGSPCFHTISERIKFRTAAAINNRTKRTLLMETKAVIAMYEARGFTITRVEGDREFACIATDLLPIPINIADADDHAHEVEINSNS
jgi:hypothetical protein